MGELSKLCILKAELAPEKCKLSMCANESEVSLVHTPFSRDKEGNICRLEDVKMRVTAKAHRSACLCDDRCSQAGSAVAVFSEAL